MSDLFRFMVLRAPETPNQDAIIQIDGSNPSPLIADLRTASAAPSPQASMVAVAQKYLSQKEQFVATPDSLGYGKQYLKLFGALQLATGSKTDSKTLASVTQSVFPKPAQIVVDKRFLEDKRRVHDSLIALQVAPLTDSMDPAILVNISRTIDVLERVAADDASIRNPGAALSATTRVVVLPAKLFPIPSPVDVSPPAPGPTGSVSSTPNVDQIASLREAIAAVDAMIAVNSSTVDAAPAIQPNLTQRLAQATNTQAQATTRDTASAFKTRARNLASTQISAQGKDAGLHAITPPVQQTLLDLNIDLTKTSLVSASAQLNEHLIGLYVAPDPFHEPSPPLESSDPLPTVLVTPPNSHGTIMPAGIVDLLVVREHVLRYEPGEIAFVENVAAGEVFKRETVRKNATLNSTLVATFSSSQTERDLQTSDRFNLQQQAQSAANQSTSAGVSSSAAYGPLVDSGSASSLSTAAASSFGQDVTNRAVTNLISSRQTDTFQQTTTEFDETVDHGFDNSKTGATPEIVVYQWLDKIVQAKVFTYGKRALYDFVVPEPAVFLAYARAAWQPALAKLQKPTTFDLQAATLSTVPTSDFFYQTWAAGYGASNVQPPPEPTITIAKTYGDKGTDPQGNDGTVLFNGIGAKDNIDILPGYQASKVYVSIDYFGGPPNMGVDVIVGDAYFYFNQSSTPNASQNLNSHQVGQIPVNVSVWNAGIYTVNVEIVCTVTEQFMAQWKSRTHDTILQASRDREAEYEDQLRKLTADIQIKYAGQSSEEKQTLIRDELEKACITILSNQHFDALNAIEYSPTGPTGTPQLFLPNVEPVGRYIRFFEQAFEWDQMLYNYFPYFWGRKKYWNDRLQLDDVDGDFAAFLRAGAARITVPVRKGYEAVVATFMLNGTIPSTSDLLAVSTGLYVPFFVELMGSDGAPDTAVPYGNPPLEWELRVPTTLVKVRTDNTLPRWKQKVDAANHVTYVPDLPGDPVNP
jgi:hypothetical protein